VPGITENIPSDSAAEPLVTVVIPTRGRPGLVLRAVRSALDQTYPHIEVLVVIDGEDPNTVHALQSIHDPRVVTIEIKENQGGSTARNWGTRSARGSWIGFLDDDDEWLPHKLERQMGIAMKVKSDSVFATCRAFKCEPGQPDQIVPKRLPRAGEDTSEYMFCPSDGTRPLSGPQTSGYLGTKKLFLDVPFTPELKCHQDWDWYLRVMHHPTAVAIPLDEPLYRLHVEPRPSMTRQASWKISLDWANSRKDLMTQRAYTAFLIHDCMYRCEITKGRLKIFRTLLAAAKESGSLRAGDCLAAAQWYVFKPALRLSLRSLTRHIRASMALIRALSRHGHPAETWEVEG
jgi:glycosyltransferase involved in cell wall biosynthesis